MKRRRALKPGLTRRNVQKRRVCRVRMDRGRAHQLVDLAPKMNISGPTTSSLLLNRYQMKQNIGRSVETREKRFVVEQFLPLLYESSTCKPSCRTRGEKWPISLGSDPGERPKTGGGGLKLSNPKAHHWLLEGRASHGSIPSKDKVSDRRYALLYAVENNLNRLFRQLPRSGFSSCAKFSDLENAVIYQRKRT